MALDPIVLDDLDWKGMVEAIRRRIPAASDGQWTLHAPVDPGVTLLELFAWQLEQRLFRMDQVPETLDRALLSLLGVRPRRARCARSVLQLQGSAGRVPRRSEFTLDGSAPPLVYATAAPVVVLPLADEPTRLWIGGRERSADLQAGRVIRLFPADGNAADLRIEFALTAPPPAAGSAGFGLWVELRVPGALAPSWSPDAVPAVPPPAALTWRYRAAGGQLRPFPVDDGTAGLRRSGVMRLRVPADWQPEPDSGRWALRVETAATRFASPPRLIALVPNAVVARHAHAVSASCSDVAAEWLPLPGNSIPLDAQPLPSACVLQLKERDGAWHRWWPIASLQACGPADRRFVVDREQARLRFGDGLNGRLPVLQGGRSDGHVGLRYLTGGGADGAVGPSPGGAPDWSGAQARQAVNLTESVGGAEAESIADARLRAAALLRQPRRAVTRGDFEAIALATQGVALRRAHAAIGRHPSQPCGFVPGAVTVIVVPEVPREDLDPDRVEDAFVAAPQPDPGALAAVRAALEAARLVCTEVFVRGPRYRAVRLRAEMRGSSDDPAALQRAVFAALQRFLDPLVGGNAGLGWPFGEPVRAAVMLREVQAAAGPRVRVERVAMGLDGEVPGESCRALDIGPDDLVWLQDLALRVVPAAAGPEGLR